MAKALKRVSVIPRPPARAADAHKGTFGKVLVIGGSVGMAGAPSLVGAAALRSGAGLVTIASPAPIQPTVAGLCPCATTIPLPATQTGQIDPVASMKVFRDRGWLGRESAPSVLVVGPGIGLGSERFGQELWKIINAFRNQPRVPAVIDADALNLAIESRRKSPNAWNRQLPYRTVITPHPGEMARLHGVATKDIQADREGWAVRTARMMAGDRFDPDHTPVVVLKGAGTVVTDGRRVYVNRTGNPGMATGGSGDVLTGLTAALLAQHLPPFEAACLAVWCHGRAGDLAAADLGEVSLIATDLLDYLPRATKEIVN